MKLAIHQRNNSFSDPWIKYCLEKGIPYKIVNCFGNDIVEHISDCDALMWHHSHGDYKDIHLAKPLLFSLEQAGMKVFPNFNTSWHFDNKLGQKYLLEAIGAPLVGSYIFYDKKSAMEWASKASFPKVFKLKGGAGAANVKLVKSGEYAKTLIAKCFGRGFPLDSSWRYFKDISNKRILTPDKIVDIARGIKHGLFLSDNQKLHSRERGYAYFQDFMPNNDSDTRVIVIGDKAFAIKRMVRKDDFRASGSGCIVYDPSVIDKRCLEIAFKTSKRLRAQCLAYDFVFDVSGNPLIVEISFGFSMAAYAACPGFWGADLNWHQGQFNPYGWMVEDLLDTEGLLI